MPAGYRVHRPPYAAVVDHRSDTGDQRREFAADAGDGWPAPPPRIDTQALHDWAIELGLDAVGVAQAEPYERAEQAIADRSARGLFADLKFTMSRPETSCHPEGLVEHASSVISAALSYWAPDEAAAPGVGTTGRIARYTRGDAYQALADRLERIAAWLEASGHRARVLVDSNHHVDREAAVRSGVGFAAKNTNVITRHAGSWVVLGTIITDAAFESDEPMRPGCGSCTRCIDACPTDAIVDGGHVLDVNRCITYWTQSRHPIPTDVRDVMGDMLYGCDICQDVCPWNRGTEGRRSDIDPVPGAAIDLLSWLTAPDDELDATYERFFVPRRDMRYLRRNALVALGNRGKPEEAPLAAAYLEHHDPMIREHARWAITQMRDEPFDQ